MPTLKHIRTRTPSPDLRNFPDFLILGPQRTGTTWLQYILALHPQIRMNRLKETYYFSTLGQPEHKHFRYPFLEDYLDSFNEIPGEILKKNYDCIRKSLSLYRPKIIGEATASYSILPEEIISEIAQLNPDIKGILMLRHPMERVWSHAKKALVRDMPEGTKATFANYKEFFERQGQRQRADYPSMIQAWKKYLRPGNLCLGHYDCIKENPKKILHDIERFLGVTTKALFFNRHLTLRINPTPELEMPPDVKELIGEFWKKDSEAYQALIEELRRDPRGVVLAG